MERRIREFQTLVKFVNQNKLEATIVGDFNFGIDSHDLAGGSLEKVVEEKYKIDLHGWKLPIQEKTMIDVRKSRINDGILTQRHVKEYGVEKPQHHDNTAFTTQEKKFCLVKMTYLRRLRMSAYTDHFPVWAHVHI